ncbi:MAG: NAD(P)-dependent oxidoreductase [Tateyamaria sp.]|jgi:uronate dehydrogenase|uniref:NAD-dependent epimerase/dehydratase family protein n=1 Tax=unclassified Tateyamaria TaxID=2645127 RepID=UPI000D54F390|nr:NAD(P)-dependent oxidoreductase [Tateyamaria sp. Alg231-49]
MKKLVLTGAAGSLGSRLRPVLAAMCDELVSTDIVDSVEELAANETYVKADIADMGAVAPLLEGADMVIHFGAVVDEKPFEELLGPNFVGAYNVWEAAYRHGVRRVVYASSIHAVGMYPKNEHIGIDVPHRPDTFYGLAKCFAEDLGRMYWEKRGIESVCLRIYSCADVTNPRAVGSWLSYPDMIRLVKRAIDTPITGFSIIYGISDNDRAPVDNTGAAHLGYRPQDNAEQFAEEIYANSDPLDPQNPSHYRHGGPFAGIELGKSAMSALNLKKDD